MVYLISDNHFGHARMLHASGREFESVMQMDSFMIKKWNSVVSHHDEVYHLGDFAFGNRDYMCSLLMALAGRKHLILGNHETRTRTWYRDVGFHTVESGVILEDRYLLTHKPLPLVREPYVNVHGHLHERKLDGSYINVSVEQVGYTPVLLEYLKSGR